MARGSSTFPPPKSLVSNVVALWIWTLQDAGLCHGYTGLVRVADYDWIDYTEVAI